MSLPEVAIWTRFRTRPSGYKFRRQHPAGPYILDFFCSEAALAIEIDGAAHDMGERPAADDRRDEWLAERGIRTLRIAARAVMDDPEAIVEGIVAVCRERGNPLHHPADGPPPRSGEEIK